MTIPLDQHVLVPKGPQAAHIAELWWLYASILAIVCILVWAFVLVALLRRQAGEEATKPPRVDEETLSEIGPTERPLQALTAGAEKRRAKFALAATAVAVAILFVLLIESVATSSFLAQPPNSRALRIQVTGHRWWWSVRYLDPEPSNVFVTANEIHLPIGRPVELQLTSADVIHSFWVPNLHGKRDLVPGRTSTLTLQADVPGSYRGQCAEFCGHAHAQMALVVFAEPAARFEAWRKAQLTPAAPPSNEEAKRGQQLFLSGPCVMCHAVSGTIAQSSVGPDLSHVASRSTLAAASFPNTRGHLAGWLLNAPNLKPGTAMPSLSLPSHELHALIAYLETLR